MGVTIMAKKVDVKEYQCELIKVGTVWGTNVVKSIKM